MASFQSKQRPHLDRLSRSKWDEVLQLRLKDSLIELDVVAMNSMARTVGRKAWWMASLLVEQLQIPMNVVTYNSLISSADWPWSLALFEQMQQTRWSPNIISFNAALKVMDNWIKALHLFHAAQGLQPDLVTCSTLGSRLGPWYFAASAVTQMMMRGFRLNTLTYNAFANSIQPGDWKSSNLLLSQTAMQRDLVSYSIMMDGHQEISDWPFAFHFLQKTQQLAIRPDPALFHIALKNLEDSKRWTSSLSILSAQKSLGQVATGVSYALTLGSFGAFGSSPRWAMALQLMEGAEATGQKPQQGSFTALLDSVEWQTSLQLCRRMEMVSVLQSAQSTNKIMSTFREEWSLASDLLQGLFLRRLSPLPRADTTPVMPGPWQRALALGKDRWLTSFSWSLAMCLLNQAVSLETTMHNAVVSACEKSTRWTWAMELLQRITTVGRPSTASFNAAASASFGHWGIVLDIFQRLSQRHLQATAFSFTTALSSCEKCHAWQRALAILVDQAPARVAVFNAAISSCERGRQWRKALALLFDMDLFSIEKDVISLNSAISCCEKCSRWCESLALLHDMRFQELFPDMFSINSALLSCRNAHRWREALDLFDCVKQFSLQADALSWDFVLAACEECGQWMQANALLLKLRELSDLQFLRPFDTGGNKRA